MSLFHHCYNLQPTTLIPIITYAKGCKYCEYEDICVNYPRCDEF